MAEGRARVHLFVLLLVVAVAVIADFAFTGVWTVRQDEQGVVLRFGAVNRVLGPGIQFTFPWPVESVSVLNTRETRKMPVGFRLVPGRDPTPAGPNEAQWLTGDMNVIDINMMIHYVISDPVKYLFRAGPEAASFLVRKSAESMLTETISRMQVDEVFTTGKIAIQDKTLRGAQSLLDRIGAGIRLLSASIQDVAPPEEVKKAFNDVSRAKADKERSIKEADGYVNDKLPRARAEANKIMQDARIYENTVLTEARGRTGRFLSLLEEYARAKEVTRTRLYLETVELVLSRVKKIIVGKDGEGKARVRIITSPKAAAPKGEAGKKTAGTGASGGG